MLQCIYRPAELDGFVEVILLPTGTHDVRDSKSWRIIVT
jgi:hypothetical protein